MDEKTTRYYLTSLRLCDKLRNEIKRNQDEADSFFGGDIYRAYVRATDEALYKATKIRSKLRNINN